MISSNLCGELTFIEQAEQKNVTERNQLQTMIIRIIINLKLQAKSLLIKALSYRLEFSPDMPSSFFLVVFFCCCCFHFVF